MKQKSKSFSLASFFTQSHRNRSQPTDIRINETPIISSIFHFPIKKNQLQSISSPLVGSLHLHPSTSIRCSPRSARFEKKHRNFIRLSVRSIRLGVFATATQTQQSTVGPPICVCSTSLSSYRSPGLVPRLKL